jgi:hypothetical protein
MVLSKPVGDDAPASENLEIVEEVEPGASYGLRALGAAVTDLVLADDGIFGAAVPVRETTLQVVDRRNGYPITRVKGITLQQELNLAREQFEKDLAELTTKQFIDKYTGADASYSAHWYRVHTCTECHRQFAGSEQQKLGVEECPACAHELRSGNFAKLVRGRVSVRVPDRFFQARCAQSFVDHGWSLIGSISGAVSLERGRFESATIMIAPGVWVQRHDQTA